MRFANLCPAKSLRVYAIPIASLTTYKASKSGYDMEPDKIYYVPDESIESQAEAEKKLHDSEEQHSQNFSF